MYYAGGWKKFGNGTSTTNMELLPVNHKFRITYGGARQEKWQNIGSSANVTFQTKLVTFKLLASDGATQLTGQTMYYLPVAGNSLEMGRQLNTMELLPVNHKFRITYGGARQEKMAECCQQSDCSVPNRTSSFNEWKCHDVLCKWLEDVCTGHGTAAVKIQVSIQRRHSGDLLSD